MQLGTYPKQLVDNIPTTPTRFQWELLTGS